MNKISTAIYMLIALVVIVLAMSMTKPLIVDSTSTPGAKYIKLFNFKA
jgi:hypothetical protein